MVIDEKDMEQELTPKEFEEYLLRNTTRDLASPEERKQFAAEVRRALFGLAEDDGTMPESVLKAMENVRTKDGASIYPDAKGIFGKFGKRVKCAACVASVAATAAAIVAAAAALIASGGPISALAATLAASFGISSELAFAALAGASAGALATKLCKMC